MKWFENKRNLIVDLVGWMFILLFTYAGLSKLLEFPEFRSQLGQSPLLTPYAEYVAWVIPSLEILIAMAILVPKFKLLALYACLFLMSLFTFYILAILNFSDYIPCSCGGILENLSWRDHLIFNILFILLAIIAIGLYPKLTTTIDLKIFYRDKKGEAENLKE